MSEEASKQTRDINQPKHTHTKNNHLSELVIKTNIIPHTSTQSLTCIELLINYVSIEDFSQLNALSFIIFRVPNVDSAFPRFLSFRGDFPDSKVFILLFDKYLLYCAR